MPKRQLRSDRTQTESEFYAQQDAELKAAGIRRTKTKKALKATKAAYAARIAEAVEAAKSEAAAQATAIPITAPATSATTTTTTTEADVQTQPIVLKPGQKCPVCGCNCHATDSPDGDASTDPPTSQTGAKSSWRKRDGTDHQIKRDVIPRRCLAGRIGKRFPQTRSKSTKGLPNLRGVSCYRNALLQCLIHIPDVYHLLGNIHKDCDRPADQCTMCVLQKVVQYYWNPRGGNKKSQARELDILMEEFRQALQTDISQGTSDRAPGFLIKAEVLHDGQCSSYDFWKGLLEILKSQVVSDSVARTLLSKAFDVKYRGTWRCEVCGLRHRDDQEQTEPGLDINPFMLLPERGLDLIDYINQATLSTTAPFKCESDTCTAAREAFPEKAVGSHTKRFRITTAPEVLVIRTQRMGYPIDEKTNLPVYEDNGDETEQCKLEDDIPYSEYLDLSSFSDDLELSLLYKLMGVVYHHGSGASGHYIAMARSRLDDGKFALCNDASIDLPEDIEECLSAVTFDDDTTFLPYVLVYSRI
ncbi:hypothetical protein AC579_834 [Pseudocercospora musae]|uniref:ubiquitinyl hydrolase 1 n=1 Tax=Pseudocercospora musae TaxID=113226 RepID=A0A139I8W5_9PEZI|nr:hypothetical protein AC579_834 [Pseudocercospora musae]